MTYFSGEQKRILKTLWLPALISLVWSVITNWLFRRYAFDNNSSDLTNVISLLMNVNFVLLIAWEFIIRRAYRPLLLLVLISLALDVVVYFNVKLFGKELFLTLGLDFSLAFLITFILKMAIRSYFAGNRNYWVTAVVAALAVQIAFSSGHQAVAFLAERLGFRWQGTSFEAYGILRLMVTSLFTYVYYGLLYLVENWFNTAGYRPLLRSKIQVTNAKEFLFLYFIMAWICWGGAILAGRHIDDAFSRYLWVVDRYAPQAQLFSYTIFITFFSLLLLFLVAGYLLRNIIVARMLSVQNQNGWLYMLHFIPVLNIIPLVVLARAKPVNETPEQNAEYYLTREKSSLANAIIIVGIIVAAITFIFIIVDKNGYGRTYGSNWKLPAVLAISAVFVFLKAMNYLLLPKFRNAVYVLLVCNILATILNWATDPRNIGLYMIEILLAYLSCYLLLEVFHPALFNADAQAAPEAFRETEDPQ